MSKRKVMNKWRSDRVIDIGNGPRAACCCLYRTFITDKSCCPCSPENLEFAIGKRANRKGTMERNVTEFAGMDRWSQLGLSGCNLLGTSCKPLLSSPLAALTRRLRARNLLDLSSLKAGDLPGPTGLRFNPVVVRHQHEIFRMALAQLWLRNWDHFPLPHL